MKLDIIDELITLIAERDALYNYYCGETSHKPCRMMMSMNMVNQLDIYHSEDAGVIAQKVCKINDLDSYSVIPYMLAEYINEDNIPDMNIYPFHHSIYYDICAFADYVTLYLNIIKHDKKCYFDSLSSILHRIEEFDIPNIEHFDARSIIDEVK